MSAVVIVALASSALIVLTMLALGAVALWELREERECQRRERVMREYREAGRYTRRHYARGR